MTICIDRISKTYYRRGREIAVLDDVSLDVPIGEVATVIGGRAAGKSTLMRIAAGLQRPDSGHVTIAGKRLDHLTTDELTRIRRMEIGCVWNSAPPIGRSSVRDVVALPLRLQTGDGRSAIREADRTLESLDVAHCASAAMNELSDGERQLVSVAQALVAKPRYLLLDQPVSDLHLTTERSLLGTLTGLAEESRVAILMTARNATEVASAGVVRSLRYGRLLGDGLSGNDPDREAMESARVVPIDRTRRELRNGDPTDA